MAQFKPPTRLPIWLILLAIIILFPKLLPLLIFLYILSRIITPTFTSRWKEKIQNWKTEGFDISAFQQQNRNTKTKKPFSSPSPPSSSFFRNPMNEFQFRARHIVGIIGLLILIFIIVDGLVSVPAGHVAVIYDRGRGVLERELPEGLHLKIPFWQVATIMDTRLQAYTMSVATYEGQLVGDDSIEALTKDGQKVDMDVTIQYRIEPDKASEIFRTIGLDYPDKIVRPEVRSVVREVVTGYESKQLFTIETRQKASQEMEKQLAAQYEGQNIILESLLLRNIRFSQVYLNAIEEKQVAEQKIQKAEFERQEAEKRKEKTIIEAQAEAESIRLKGESLRNNPEVIQLEFVNKMASQINWGILPDGVLPLIDVSKLQQ